MSLADPTTFSLNGDSRLRASLSLLDRRVAALERGAGGGNSPGPTSSATPDATTAVKGKVKLAGVLAGTADVPVFDSSRMTLTSGGQIQLPVTGFNAGVRIGGDLRIYHNSLSASNSWLQIFRDSWDGSEGGEFYNFRVSPGAFTNGTSGRRGTLDASDPVGDSSYKYAGSNLASAHAIGSATLTLTGSTAGWPATGAAIVGDSVLAYTSVAGSVITLAANTTVAYAAGVPVRDSRSEWTRLPGANGLGTTYWAGIVVGSLYWTGRGSWHDYLANHHSQEARATVSIVASPGGVTNSGGLTLITTTAAHHLITGDTVEIAGATGGPGTYAISGPNGYFKVTRVSGTTFTLDGSTWSGSAGGGGAVQPHAYKESVAYQAHLTNNGYGHLLEGCEYGIITNKPAQTQGVTIVLHEVPSYFQYKPTGGGSGVGLPTRVQNAGSIGMRFVSAPEAVGGQTGSAITLEAATAGGIRRAIVLSNGGVDTWCLDGVTGYIGSGSGVTTDQAGIIPARLTLGAGNPTLPADGIQFGTTNTTRLWRSGNYTLQTDGAFGVGPSSWAAAAGMGPSSGSLFFSTDGRIDLTQDSNASMIRGFTPDYGATSVPTFIEYSTGKRQYGAGGGVALDQTFERSQTTGALLIWSLTGASSGALAVEGGGVFGKDALPTNSDVALEVINAGGASTDGRALLLSRVSTAQQSNLTPVNGMVVYNTTTGDFEGYKAGAWVSLTTGGAGASAGGGPFN